MRITDALLGEHGAFAPILAHLENTLPAAGSAHEVRGLGQLLAASLASHARLEDELLFTALEPYIGAAVGPLAVMRMEHELIEGNLRRLPQAESLDLAQRLLMQAVATAQEHFAKEEQILFPLALQSLGNDTLCELGGRWAQRRGVALVASLACSE